MVYDEPYVPQVIDFGKEHEFILVDRPHFVQGTGDGYWLLIDMETRKVIGFRWRDDLPITLSPTPAAGGEG